MPERNVGPCAGSGVCVCATATVPAVTLISTASNLRMGGILRFSGVSSQESDTRFVQSSIIRHDDKPFAAGGGSGPQVATCRGEQAFFLVEHPDLCACPA